MARILVTGSSQGLGLMSGRLLAAEGHAVVLHARDAARAEAARAALPEALDVVAGDLSTLAGMREVADQANALGRFDAVIHNVGIGYREPARVETEDGLSHLWAVNVLAPYALMVQQPGRLAAADEMHDSLTALIPLGRLAPAGEVASAALFLADGESSFITGSELSVDGSMAQV